VIGNVIGGLSEAKMAEDEREHEERLADKNQQRIAESYAGVGDAALGDLRWASPTRGASQATRRRPRVV